MGQIDSAAIHLRTRDRVKLIDALRALCQAEGLRPVLGEARERPPRGARRFLLLPPAGQWTTLVPEDAGRARDLARDLSLAGEVPALAVLLVDDGFAFAYEAYDAKGKEVDAYHSCPDAELPFGAPDVPDAELDRTRGEPSKLSALGVSPEAIEKVAPVLADARIERLADHDVSKGKYADAERPLGIFNKALGLGDALEEGFDALWDLGLEEEGEADLRYLVYAPPKEQQGLRGLWGRLRGKQEEQADEAEEDEEEPEDEDEPLDEEDDD
ncbi:MAG: hypothetical protein AB7N76_07360 [Planctomycetota bacterium]